LRLRTWVCIIWHEYRRWALATEFGLLFWFSFREFSCLFCFCFSNTLRLRQSIRFLSKTITSCVIIVVSCL
jgi:hypothetical protein